MFPFASLPDNLAAFCRMLNRAYDFRIGPRELQDALRALSTAPLDNERTVRDRLRPVLGSRLDDVLVFDRAFAAFFLGAPESTTARSAAQTFPKPANPQLSRRNARTDAMPPVDADVHRKAGDVTDIEPGDGHEETDAEGARLRARYSPLEAVGPTPALEPADARWRAAARRFVRSVEVGRSRRWRPARRGPRFDLRRTLRASLHSGGEVIDIRWRDRPRRRPAFVLLVDGSRSMSPHAAAPLRLAVALATVSPDVETFVFSTELARVTRDVSLAAIGARRLLPEVERAWGGGTRMGACLADFVRRFGERLLTGRTVVIIASDGLDVGPPRVLRGAMARIGREAAAVIWLNPLVDTPGYEPTAAGMQAARPFVTNFTWVDDPEGLRRLAQTVRFRR